MRIVVAAHTRFRDQVVMQNAVAQLFAKHPSSTFIVGANKVDKMAGQLWRLLGGTVTTDEPKFGRERDVKVVMQERDRRLFSQQVGLCLSFEHAGQASALTHVCEKRGVSVQRVDDAPLSTP